MKQTRYISFAAGMLMLLAPICSHAQALPFTAIDYNPSTLARGGASAVETSDFAYSAFRNAAAVPFADSKADFAVGYTMWKPSSSNMIDLAGAYNINNKFGVALGFSYGMHPAYDIVNSDGIAKGSFAPSDMQIHAGFAWRFTSFLSAGVNVGYATQALAEDASYGAVAADVFLMGQFSGAEVAIGVSNLGSSVGSFQLPASLTLGAGYGLDFAQVHGVDVQLDADYYFSGALAAALGAEYTYNDLVSARVGYRYGGKSVVPSFLSVGAGVKFIGIKVNLTYLISNAPIGNTLAVGLGYSF